MSAPSPEPASHAARSGGRVDAAAVILVFIGGLIGTGLRIGVGEAFASPEGTWPWATLGVNVAGAYLLGRVVRWLGTSRRRPHLEPMLATGLMGALTTFSTFGVETLELASAGGVASAIFYAGVSVTLGLLAAARGLGLAWT